MVFKAPLGRTNPMELLTILAIAAAAAETAAPARSTVTTAARGFFASPRHLAYFQLPARFRAAGPSAGLNVSDFAALRKLAAGGLDTLIVVPETLRNLLNASTPAQRAELLRFDFVLSAAWPSRGLDIGDVTESAFLPPLLRGSLSDALAISMDTAPDSPHVVGYYIADEPAWNKQSLFVNVAASKHNMVLLNGFGETCNWGGAVPRPAGARGNWYTGFDVPCQRCLSSATGVGSDVELSAGKCGTAGQRSTSHWDITLLPESHPSNSPTVRAVWIRNNQTARYLCADGTAFSLEVQRTERCTWLVTDPYARGTVALNIAPTLLQHSSSGHYVCGNQSIDGQLFLNATGDARACSWQTFMWTAGLLNRMAKFLRATDREKDAQGRPLRAIAIGGTPTAMRLVREWNQTNNWTAGDISCTMPDKGSCDVSCVGPHASDDLVAGALAVSPVAVASRDAFDVFLIDFYSGTLSKFKRSLMLYLKQGSFTRETLWMPVLESWKAQPAAVGAASGCAAWGAASARSTGGTLAEKMGWWRQAAAELSGCVTAPVGAALFAFQATGLDWNRPSDSSFASLANCGVMQEQATELFEA